jgi:hypothetical protein
MKIIVVTALAAFAFGTGVQAQYFAERGITVK